MDDLDVDGAASTGRCTPSDVGDTVCVARVVSGKRHVEICDGSGAQIWSGSALRSCAHRAAGAALARKQVVTLDVDDPSLAWPFLLLAIQNVWLESPPWADKSDDVIRAVFQFGVAVVYAVTPLVLWKQHRQRRGGSAQHRKSGN